MDLPGVSSKDRASCQSHASPYPFSDLSWKNPNLIFIAKISGFVFEKPEAFLYL